jgi:hypothetical protein
MFCGEPKRFFEDVKEAKETSMHAREGSLAPMHARVCSLINVFFLVSRLESHDEEGLAIFFNFVYSDYFSISSPEITQVLTETRRSCVILQSWPSLVQKYRASQR